MFRKLFGEHGAKNVITLFHKPNNSASTRVLTLLKQQAATASATATEDQASSHETQSKIERAEFDLDVVEDAPTQDQLKTIMGYIGAQNAASVVEGASSEADAEKKVKSRPDAFVRPLVVDWHQGKVVAGDNESEILNLLKGLQQKQK